MTVLSVLPIYQSKCEYADLEYFSEAIYEKLSKYCADISTIWIWKIWLLVSLKLLLIGGKNENSNR
jgi:hypothetical protein